MAESLNSWIQNLCTSTDSIEENDVLSKQFHHIESILSGHNQYSSSAARLQSELNRLHTERKSLQQLQEQLVNIKDKQKTTEESIKAVPCISDNDNSTIKLRDLFSKTAGLHFRVKENVDAVTMVFSSLDSAQSDKECGVTIDVIQSSNKWKLIDADPPVDGLESLIDDLNASNDLYQFARNVRKLFKDSL